MSYANYTIAETTTAMHYVRWLIVREYKLCPGVQQLQPIHFCSTSRFPHQRAKCIIRQKVRVINETID